jgi:membrane peptidoglycan carboxypeptidase
VRRWLLRLAVLALWALLLAALGLLIISEVRSSRLQARFLSEYAARLSFQMQPGAAEVLLPAAQGPYDLRFGHAQLPGHLQRLVNQGYVIEAQARSTPELHKVVTHGLFPAYHEKLQAGLRLLDRAGEELFATRYPARVYARFEDIPPLIVQTLLFIENRELLETPYPRHNPAVEWDRFARAVIDQGAQLLGANINAPGGSTLATQIEKYRHSRGGRTNGASDKLRQMASASLRAYLDGPETLAARRRIVLDYLNSVPLAAVPGFGEVNGLADGLWAWADTDFDATNRTLARLDAMSGKVTTEQARHFRTVLALLLAERRPADLLTRGSAALAALTDSHLRLLAQEGRIGPALRDAALAARLSLRQGPAPQPVLGFAARKTQSLLRTRLAQQLGESRLYDLDRFDLSAASTLDRVTQEAVTRALRGLREPEAARGAGLYGERLLGPNDDLAPLTYSFTLYERTAQGNALRVQTDNYDQPLDINEGVRLDLGSTAKLRTLVHYLELISELHGRHAGTPADELGKLEIDRHDHLTRFVRDQLLETPGLTLEQLLERALERKYSANPGESFFTGGGLHTFGNFKKEDNSRIPTVREALRDSVNLSFIRIMRDIVYHHMYRPGGSARMLEDADDPRRRAYLERFADQEGRVFLRRFYNKYRGKDPAGIEQALLDSLRATPSRLATVHRSLYPEQDLAAFKRFMRAQPEAARLDDGDLAALYDKYAIERFNLHDRGYIARLHPLELWLVAYLVRQPGASFSDCVSASSRERIDVYQWLYKTHRRYAQDKRIKSLLEVEAFAGIHAAWQRVGYPFESITPSYATAIGSSADRPAALAELMGILVNDGLRLPIVRFPRLHFAAGTPFESVLARSETAGERVLPVEVARAARSALMGVVAEGTARRLGHTFVARDGTPIAIGGKTGTGDHRREQYSGRGQVISSHIVSRSATFVFFLGERHFGTLTAYVAGPRAGAYKFTSALTVQTLKSLAPLLTPLIVSAGGDQE